jgi:hypothetical protein
LENRYALLCVSHRVFPDAPDPDSTPSPVFAVCAVAAGSLPVSAADTASRKIQDELSAGTNHTLVLSRSALGKDFLMSASLISPIHRRHQPRSSLASWFASSCSTTAWICTNPSMASWSPATSRPAV